MNKKDRESTSMGMDSRDVSDPPTGKDEEPAHHKGTASPGEGKATMDDRHDHSMVKGSMEHKIMEDMSMMKSRMRGMMSMLEFVMKKDMGIPTMKMNDAMGMDSPMDMMKTMDMGNTMNIFNTMIMMNTMAIMNMMAMMNNMNLARSIHGMTMASLSMADMEMMKENMASI